MLLGYFPTAFIIIAVIIGCLALFVFIYTFRIMFSPKARSKMISRQFESLSGAANMSKEDIESILTNLSSASIKSRKNILDENEDDLKDIADANARINKDAVKETAKAIKDGFTDESNTFCKYCGKVVDSDSQYCKYCGKKIS